MTDMNELKHPVQPLDRAILDKLPDEGSMLGYHVLGKTTRALAKELSVPGVPVTSAEVATRLRVCKLNGLVVDQHGGGDRVWQRTFLARRVLQEMGVPKPVLPEDNEEEAENG